MSSAFIGNFKNLVSYLGKAACQEKDCPLDYNLLGQLINFMFNDKENEEQIFPQFTDNIDKMDSIYRKNGSSYKYALKSRDRTLFQHINLFPDKVSKSYSKYIEWFSLFLRERIQDNHIKYIWTCLDKLTEQAERLKAQ